LLKGKISNGFRSFASQLSLMGFSPFRQVAHGRSTISVNFWMIIFVGMESSDVSVKMP
jgi:hypothetical protein